MKKKTMLHSPQKARVAFYLHLNLEFEDTGRGGGGTGAVATLFILDYN